MNNPRVFNRRRSLRQKTKKHSRVKCFSGKFGLGPDIVTQVLDLSETGIRLRVKSECCEGQELEVYLTGLTHCRPIHTPGKVVWCISTAENDYCIGVQFYKPLKYRDLQML